MKIYLKLKMHYPFLAVALDCFYKLIVILNYDSSDGYSKGSTREITPFSANIMSHVIPTMSATSEELHTIVMTSDVNCLLSTPVVI